MTLNPVELFINLFWPKQEIQSKELHVRYRTLLYFSFFSILVMLYSIIKWSRLDYDILVYSAVFGFIVNVANSVYIKFSPPPILAANIFLLGNFPHGVNMIFSLGGLESSHVFWMPALVCIAYLLGDKKTGFFWFLCAFAVTVAVIYVERIEYPLPVFEFSEKGLMIDMYSGFLLPMLVIWIGQNYSYKIREESYREAMEAQRASQASAERFEKSYQRLGVILEEAQHTCSTLVKSTDSLASNLTNMTQSSAQLSDGVKEQESASAEISETVGRTVATLDQTSSMIEHMRSFTDQTENNVTSTAQSMQAATRSMSKIKERFTKIEDVIQVISEIVSQTNLLALNATIEAARAGDKGRGFAVVADEVRTLSIRCDESAREITDTINQGSADVEEGVELVSNSAQVLTQTAESVKDVSSNIRDLVDIVERLNQNMKAVAEATDKVEMTSSVNATSVASLITANSDLSQMSDELCEVSDKLQGVVNN